MDAEEDKKHITRRLTQTPCLGLIWLGVAASLITGTVLAGLMYAVPFLLEAATANWYVTGGFVYTLSAFFLVPCGMGLVGGMMWHRAGISGWGPSLYALLTIVLAMGLAAAFLHEGAICLLIASPLLIFSMLGGTWLGTALAEKQDGRLRVTILPVLAILVVCDALSPHHYANAVTDTVVIHAPAARVWPLLAGYPVITDKPDYFLWRIGLPCPTQSVADGAYVGASRECRFTQGVTIGERITDVVTGKRLAFDITRQPNNPEILGHFVLKRGEFDLTDNRNGTCTLSGTSWYGLNVYPSWYFDLWTRDIVRHVHLRVMRHIQKLAEKN